MGFGFGFDIYADKNKQSIAYADLDYWVHPKNTGNLRKSRLWLFFAGGDDLYFKPVEVEVWGLH